MRGRHHNTFYYYRGPSPKGSDEQAEAARHDRQVEDNTTKALINVLEHADPAVARSFVDRFVSRAPLNATAPAPNFFLQGGPSSVGPGERWLLGLSILGEIDPSSCAQTPSLQGSRVDAAIQVPGELLLLIEVKVIEYLDYQQLERHADEWQIPVLECDATRWAPDDPWALARWADVYRWARDAAGAVEEPVSHFLLHEFIAYLEILGLAPFGGFRDEHFAHFGQPVEKRSWETQAEVKARLAGLWEGVLEHLPPDEAGRLGEIHVARFGLTDDIAAAQTNWGEAGVNLTIEITAGELQLNVVGWTADRAEQLLRWLAPGGTVRQADALAGHDLVVFRRRPSNYAAKATGRRPFFQRETFQLVERTPLAALAGTRVAKHQVRWREDPDPAWEKLAFHIRRAWPREEAVQRGADLTRDVAAAVKQSVPVLDAIDPRPERAPPAERRIAPAERREVPNESLTLDAIPEPDTDSPSNSVTRFAITFNGYAYHSLVREVRNCQLVGRAAREEWERSGKLPPTVTELRSALFFQARADHFAGGFGLDSSYDAALVQAIRSKVANGDVEVAPSVEYLPTDYSFEDRLGDLRMVRGFEGGAVYAAERDGAFYLAIDESTTADLLDEQDSESADGWKKLLRFESAEARAAYLSDRGWIQAR